MDAEFGILEKRIEDAELMVGNSSQQNVSDLVCELRQALKNYCLQPDHADEVVKRPIDQLTNIINFSEKVSNDNIQERIMSINAQTALISHRLGLLKDIDELKGSLSVENLAKLVSYEKYIDGFLNQYSSLSDKLSGLNAIISRQQNMLDTLFHYVDSTLTAFEAETTTK